MIKDEMHFNKIARISHDMGPMLVSLLEKHGSEDVLIAMISATISLADGINCPFPVLKLLFDKACGAIEKYKKEQEK